MDIEEASNRRKVCTAFNRCGGLSPCILPAADHEEQQETSHGCLHGYTSLLCYPQNSYSEWEDKHGPHQAWEIVISRKGHRANNVVAFLSEVESYQDVEVLEGDKSSSKTASSAGVWASKFLWLSLRNTGPCSLKPKATERVSTFRETEEKHVTKIQPHLTQIWHAFRKQQSPTQFKGACEIGDLVI